MYGSYSNWQVLCLSLAKGQVAFPQSVDEEFLPELSAQCTYIFYDVIETLNPQELETLLIDIKQKNIPVVFYIKTLYSHNIHPDGRNKVTNVKPLDWWQSTLSEHLNHLRKFKTGSSHEAIFTSFEPKFRSKLLYRINLHKIRLGKKVRKKLDELYSKKITRKSIKSEELLSACKGKTVAVVGNAQSLSNSDYGDQIDNYDVVIRFNSAPIPDAKSHGRRTTFIATSFPISWELFETRGADGLIWAAPHKELQIPSWIYQNDVPCAILEQIFLDSITHQLGKPATTGHLILRLLQKGNQYKEVGLFGFDFFSSATNSSHISTELAHKHHSYNVEKSWVQSWIREDKHVKYYPANQANN